jgi:hypothetical protein
MQKRPAYFFLHMHSHLYRPIMYVPYLYFHFFYFLYVLYIYALGAYVSLVLTFVFCPVLDSHFEQSNSCFKINFLDSQWKGPLRVISFQQSEYLLLDLVNNIKKVSTLTFLVEWYGYDESESSWEPWKNLRDTSQLHEYLARKTLTKLNPAKFRTAN